MCAEYTQLQLTFFTLQPWFHFILNSLTLWLYIMLCFICSMFNIIQCMIFSIPHRTQHVQYHTCYSAHILNTIQNTTCTQYNTQPDMLKTIQCTICSLLFRERHDWYHSNHDTLNTKKTCLISYLYHNMVNTTEMKTCSIPYTVKDMHNC